LKKKPTKRNVRTADPAPKVPPREFITVDAWDWKPAESWPSLDFSTVAPIDEQNASNQKHEALRVIATMLESEDALKKNDRQLAARTLRRIEATTSVFKGNVPTQRGRPSGRAYDIAQHYIVRSELDRKTASASKHVATL
jgi:hypothetical protein